jgi:hypothetical protein
MRIWRLILGGIAIVATTGPVLAQGSLKPDASSASPIKTDIEPVPLVNAGDQIGIACNALTKSDSDSDVRVVLTISAEPGEIPPGYKKVLATEEDVGHGAVRVRIPTVPDLENHTVNVNVYVLGEKGAQSCDAGHVKIVRQHGVPPTGSTG